VKSIDSIGIDASADVGVIVNQKVGRRRRRQHEPAGGQATLDGALNVITKEGITIALRIVAWQRIRRSPGKRRLNALPCAGSGLAKASAPAEAPFVLMWSTRDDHASTLPPIVLAVFGREPPTFAKRVSAGRAIAR